MSTASALDSVTLSMEKITADEWSLQNIKLSIFDFNKSLSQLSLVSASLTLPVPFDDITLAGLHCKQFNWRENYLNCTQGRGHFKTKKQPFIDFDFALKVEYEKAILSLQSVSLFGGKIDVYIQETKGQWQLKIKAKNLDLEQLQVFFVLPSLEALQGYMNADIELNGKHENIQDLQASGTITELSAQAIQGKLVSENLTLEYYFQGYKKGSEWLWDTSNELLLGGLYAEPVYLDLQSRPLTLLANGLWLSEQNVIHIDSVELEQLNTSLVKGKALLDYQTDLIIKSADFSVSMPELQVAAPIYLKPFLETSIFEGISLAGSVDSRLIIALNKVTAITIDFKHLMLDDTQQQFYLKDAFATFNWTQNAETSLSSYLNWQQLRIKAIPFESGQIDFMVYDKQLELLNKADLPVLGGILSINQFSFAAVENDDANIHFEGSINQLSLKQLSEVLNWTPLSGNISGYIPSVNYQNKKLELDGELKIQVFNGEITIKKLASSGMFTDFAQFYTDIEIDNLDLHALTRKFQIGNIEGQLSGFARNVYLENWQPVSFYAWLGTPDDDDSRHKISQKAVKNIASVGGGGAVDAISRSFLSIFDNFGYNKLGFGCYLHQGVCQIMAFEPVNDGFYLIKGGGLPQINVIGYNPRIDWDVLVRRLNRIATSDEVIVK